jgi:1,4-dihydroxy-2-naphthoate octaprenyltransferase
LKRVFLRIIRPHIVAGGILAFTLGSLLGLASGGRFNIINFVVCYSTVFFGDLSTHFSNDYFDFKHDKTTKNKSMFSGRRILVNNPEMLPWAKRIALALLFVSLLVAGLAVLTKIAPIEIFFVMIGANILGWFYSAKPLRLVSKGLGEVAIALAVGFAIPTVGYLSSKGSFDGLFRFFFIPFILYGLMLALSLEAPDIEGDYLGDKKTLGVLKGTTAVFVAALFAAISAFCIFLSYSILYSSSSINLSVITAFSTIPLTTALLSLINIRKNKNPQISSVINVASLFAVNLLIIAYLLAILFF